jgi:hypothetical protein
MIRRVDLRPPIARDEVIYYIPIRHARFVVRDSLLGQILDKPFGEDFLAGTVFLEAVLAGAECGARFRIALISIPQLLACTLRLSLSPLVAVTELASQPASVRAG